MVYIMRQDAAGKSSQGLCIPCAKEMGISIPSNIDINEDLMQNFMEQFTSGMDENDLSDDEGGRAPSIDLNMLFNNRRSDGKDEKDPKKSPNARPQRMSPPAKKSIEQFCLNLTQKAAEGKLDKIVGRSRELERVIQILCRRQKNNPCLIGEPGVGKTAIAEALAQRIASGEVPYRLKNKEVQLVDMTALVAGTQFRGQFEARMKALINEVKALGNIILVIDEVHSIVGAGDAEGSMNAANILKPALSRGEIQLIGATTLKEYRKYIEKDSALERRFQPIIVEENSIEDTIKILEGIKHYYEEYHKINVPADLLYKAVSLSERYITERFLPDKAIDLLDEACSYLALRSPAIGEYEELNDKLKKLTAKEEALEGKEIKDKMSEAEINEHYQEIAVTKSNILNVKKQIEKTEENVKQITLTKDHLAKVIEIWTGIPASNITEDEFEQLSKLEENLKKNIIGQDKAVSAVTNAIKRNRVGVSAKRKPVSFIFAGPTGVGKTELVKRLAAELFNAPESLIRLDMSEFMEKHAVSRIIGAPPGYVGYDDAGQLTEKIRRKPYSVVLFDEIEKAHPDVMNILLQILDDGKITDAQGRSVNFENTIIIMTTNAGSHGGGGVLGFHESKQTQNEEKTMNSLSEFLRPEFLNRIDEVITFRALDEGDFERIAVIMLDELCDALKDRGYSVSYSEKAQNAVAKNSFSEKYGARNMRRYIQNNIEDKIANVVVDSRGEKIELISIDSDDELKEITIKTA